MRKIFPTLVFLFAAAVASAVDYYASPTGSGTACTKAAPCSLNDLLNHTNGVTHPAAGDTVWLRGDPNRGTTFIYTNGATSGAKFYCQAGGPGTISAWVTYRVYPGERAIIDGNGTSGQTFFPFTGCGFLVVRDMEIEDTFAAKDCSGASIHCPTLAFINKSESGPIRWINNVIHDGAQTCLSPFNAFGNEVYGNLFYYCGAFGNQAHSLYNNDGSGIPWDVLYAPKINVDSNISMNSGGYGLHFWGVSTNKVIQNNIVCCAGTLGGGTSGGDLIIGHDTNIGGGFSVTGVTINNNYLYRAAGENTGTLHIGYFANGTPISNSFITNNYVCCGDVRLDGYVLDGTNVFTGNSFRGNMFQNGTAHLPASIPGTPANTVDDSGTWPSSGNKPAVIPNKYEAGRCNVGIFNWDLANTVAVDLSTCLRVGDDYAIYWWANFSTRTASATGTYAGGTVNFPMTTAANGSMPALIWSGGTTPTTALPQFGAFIVITTRRRN